MRFNDNDDISRSYTAGPQPLITTVNNSNNKTLHFGINTNWVQDGLPRHRVENVLLDTRARVYNMSTVLADVSVFDVPNRIIIIKKRTCIRVQYNIMCISTAGR